MANSNFNEFKKNLDNEIKRQQEEQKKEYKSIVFELYSTVQKNTPVDKGYLRTNNILSVNQRSYDQLDIIKDESELLSEAKGKLNSMTLKDGSTNFIQNNMPYADRIEYEGHSSIKAPQGFYRISLKQVQRAVARSRREVIKGRAI